VAVVLIDPRQPRVTPNEAVLSGIGPDAAAVESQVEIFESSTLARRVIASLGLDREGELVTPSLTGRAISAVRRLVGRPGASPQEAEQANRIVQRFQSQLHVRRRGLTYVLEVAYSSADRDNAARVANAVAEAYLADQAAAKSDATTRASGWLGERINELRERARQAESAVTAFRNENRLVDLAQRETLLERQISDLNQQLSLAQARTAETRARYEQARQSAQRPGGGGSVTESLQSPVIANLRVQYSQLAANEAELRLTYGTRHPALTNVRAQLRDVERQIDTEIRRISTGLRNEFETAQARQATLERNLMALREQVAVSNTSRDRLRELEREAQASRSVLEQFLLRFRETNEQQSMRGVETRVISPAMPPQQPSSPKTGLTLALGLIGGLFAGVGAAALSDGLRPRFRDAAEIEAALGLPVRATIPRGAAGHGTESKFSHLHAARVAQSLLPLASELWRDAKSDQHRIVLVTSTTDSEGRTFVASHLATLLGRSGCRVLLVDLDVANAGLSRQRSGEDKPGLLELLQGDLPAKPFIQTDEALRVDFLPLGRSARTGPDAVLVPGPRLERILGEVRALYDVVLLDGPALLGSAEGRSLVRIADHVAVVVAPERVGRNEVLSALAGFQFGALKPVSVVLNGGAGRRMRS
jgi:uncharacterized protein involved in exopolysaccharide biosynthesis/Mrp family chromosome partitioning ATPase